MTGAGCLAPVCCGILAPMPNLTIELDEPTLEGLRRAAALQQEPLAEVVQTALRVYAERVSNGREYVADVEASHARIREEAAVWRTLPESERRQYSADFVAVFQGRVIDHDADRVALLRRVRAMVGDEPVLITPADAEAPREFRHIGLRRAESR